MPVWEEEAAAQGWAAPEVIAHHALPARFDRYIFTAGYNTIINRRQFGFTDLNWPTEYRYPDRTYHDTLDLSVGGVDFALRHEKGETDDHTVTWQAERRVLCCGDLFIWASPNAGNPQKVQRYPREWADALRRMLALDAEFLLPGHGFPVVGADRVRQALTDTADLLDSLVDQTLAVMNAGGRLDDAIHTVRPPAALEARPYLRPVYDEPEFIVHTVWRQYGPTSNCILPRNWLWAMAGSKNFLMSSAMNTPPTNLAMSPWKSSARFTNGFSARLCDRMDAARSSRKSPKSAKQGAFITRRATSLNISLNRPSAKC